MQLRTRPPLKFNIIDTLALLKIIAAINGQHYNCLNAQLFMTVHGNSPSIVVCMTSTNLNCINYQLIIPVCKSR